MGNRALRKEVARLLKDFDGFEPFPTKPHIKKLHRLYYGSRRKAFKYLNAAILRQMIKLLTIKPGDLVNDCDGFNHRVIKHLGYYNNNVFYIEQLEFADGRWSCGCPHSPSTSLSISDIESFHRELTSDENMKYFKERGWWTNHNQKIRDALINNERICDDDGLPII